MSNSNYKSLKESIINQHIPQLTELYQRYDINSDKIERFSKEAENFTVRLPLVGAFSSGKTTLINALLNEKLFAVEVNPETALPVEISYAPTAQFIGFTSKGQSHKMSAQAVAKQQFDSLLPDGWLEAKLPAKNLQSISELTLVDMPGWDSGIDQHSKAIDAYLGRSLAYCLVVSADEGNLRDSLRNFVQELSIHKMPALVVITKADKKPQEDIDSVKDQIEKEVTKVLGQPPLGVVQVSGRKNQIQGFLDLLQSLQSKASERFSSAIVMPILGDLSGLEKRLHMLLNQENLNEEQLQVQRKDLEREMQEFKRRVELETQKIDEQLAPSARNIINDIKNSLLSQVETLASQAIGGDDLKGTIGTTVRLALAEGIEREFAPKIRAYFSKIEKELPNTLTINTNLDFESNANNRSNDIKIDASGILQTISTLLPLILTKFGPIGILVSGVVSVLFSFFGGSNKDEPEDKTEHAKNQIITKMIPQVITQVELSLKEHLRKQVEEAKLQILAATEEQSRQHQQSLNKLEEELKLEKEAFEAKRVEYTKDLAKINEIKAQLRIAG